MKTNSKKVSVANFNTVFLLGEEERPLLDYFDTILMPALQSGIERKVGNDSYLIMNVKVEKTIEEEYVLTGYIVKKTVLERFSDLDVAGNLIELDDRYSAAPYSIFIIYLKNHRMIFIENQKGSPRLDSFRSTVKHIIDNYVKMRNDELKIQEKELLPIPLVSVVGIPCRNSIERELKDVVKISSISFRFFPLNGDGDDDMAEMFGMISGEIRKKIGSKSGSINYSSPKNISGVIDLVARLNGIVEPTIKVKDKNNAKRTIKNDQFSESMSLNISGNDLQSEIDNSIMEGSKIESIKHVSEENSKIYEKNITKIIPFYKK